MRTYPAQCHGKTPLNVPEADTQEPESLDPPLLRTDDGQPNIYGSTQTKQNLTECSGKKLDDKI